MDTKDLSASESQTAVFAAEDRLTAAKVPANPSLAKDTAVLDEWAAEPSVASAAPKRLSPVLALKAGAAAAAESVAQGHDEQTALKTAASVSAQTETVSGSVPKAGEAVMAAAEAAPAPEAGGLISNMGSAIKNAYSSTKEIVGDFISGVKEVSADPKGSAQKVGGELEDGYKSLKELPSSVMAELDTMRQQMSGALSHAAATHAEPMAPSSGPMVATGGRSAGNSIG